MLFRQSRIADRDDRLSQARCPKVGSQAVALRLGVYHGFKFTTSIIRAHTSPPAVSPEQIPPVIS